jgi:multicomponent Na+:H+ antiporter subunit D
LLKGALFLCVGILLSALSSVDELNLRGRGRELMPAGVIFAVCALAIAGPPPLGTFLGKSLIEEGATELHYQWVPVVITIASIVTSGAMLRAAGRVWLGLGPPSDPYLSAEPDEEHEVGDEPPRSVTLMLIPTAALALAGIGLSLVPGLEHHTEAASHRFQDTRAYVQAVLAGHTQHPPVDNFDLLELPAASVIWGIVSTVGALLLAGFALYRERLSAVVRAVRPTAPVFSGLKTLHSGAIGDYVTWLVVGITLLGGLFAVVVR